MNQYVAEFIGTMFLIILGNGVVANVLLDKSKGQHSGWIVISTGWALAVFVGVVVAGPYSGAHLNPAVSLGLAIAGDFAWAKLPFYIAAQLGGAMSGAYIVWLFYKDHFVITENIQLKAACFCTSPAIKNKFRNLFCEVLGTFILLFVIFHFTNAEISNPKTPVGLGSLGAVPVAFLVWAIGLSLGGATGYAINPARDLGPRIVFFFLHGNKQNATEWSYAWIPVVGPLLGAVIAAVMVGYLAIS